ncbi:MAG: peptidoglycan-binding protein [Bacillota bacterium]|nr:peptidoglycan-binding protein [Bacillota bacterium]
MSRRIISKVVLVALILALPCGAFAAHFAYRPLEKGSVGEDVEELEWMLQTLGYYRGRVDGIYGPMLEAAVKSLEKRYGLPQTGKVDGRLLEMLQNLWSVFVSGEFEVHEVDPDCVIKPGTQVQLNAYTVRRGDTLTSIARRHNTRAQALARLNNLDSPDLIRIGQVLYVLKCQ